MLTRHKNPFSFLSCAVSEKSSVGLPDSLTPENHSGSSRLFVNFHYFTGYFSKLQNATALQYFPLSPEQKEFLLLRVHPRYRSASKTAFDASEASRISCDLSVVSRNDASEYKVLSYVWGNVDNTVSI
jgi:hypothetical protein